MTAWSIWKKRNLKLWENKHETADQVLNRANGVLSAWQAAQKYHDRTVSTGTNIAHSDIAELIWKPPPEGYVKCNIDASIFSTDCKVGMGAVLRDNAGQFIAATS
ncbi:ribonuclease H protein, partial [Trifolium medium]|nr:ribonuclease H protein [Trifolium medium]